MFVVVDKFDEFYPKKNAIKKTYAMTKTKT